MQVRAHLKNYRMSPRKVRLVADTVRGLDVDKAVGQLGYDLRHCSPVIKKLLESARANAVHNFDHSGKGLIISDIQVGEGPTLKRFRARAYGRAAKILKRTSCITVILSDAEQGEKSKPSANKTKKQVKKTDEVASSPPKKTTEKVVDQKATDKKDSDDLTKIEGIGPKISQTLIAAGVETFHKLSQLKPDEISEMITEVRGTHHTQTWPEQAQLAHEGKWDELKKWQDELDGGKVTS